MKNIPTDIWLHVGEDTPDNSDFYELDEVTWCSKKEESNAIHYVLANDDDEKKELEVGEQNPTIRMNKKHENIIIRLLAQDGETKVCPIIRLNGSWSLLDLRQYCFVNYKQFRGEGAKFADVYEIVNMRADILFHFNCEDCFIF